MLQTVRICTHVTDDRKVEILFTFMKLAGKEGLADAFNLGKTGNMLAQIDSKTGKFQEVYAMHKEYFEKIYDHPATRFSLIDFSVPFWQECLELAKELSLKFLPLQAVGWDIAITNNGPLAIEGNGNWVPVMPFEISHDKLKEYGLKR